MRILLNALAVLHGGSRTYFHNLINHLGRLGQQHQFVLLHSVWQQEVLDFNLPANFARLVAGPRRRSLPLRAAWEQIRLPMLLRRERIDVMFSPTPATALFCPCPTVIAVRNPNPFSALGVKDWRYKTRNWVLRMLTQPVAERAAYIVFVSKHSRDAALQALKVDPSKAVVIYHGTGPHFFEAAKKPTNELFGGPRPYVLTVSNIDTHKNYPRLIDAFAQLCQEPDWPYDYVFAGAVGSRHEFQRVRERMNQPSLKGRIHYLGEVPYQDLPVLYQGAGLFVLPSLLETFGHPLVEAMASGIPIAAANAAAIPEICGAAGIYFDPYDIDDIVRTLRCALEDKTLRERLVAHGRKRALDFSWSTTAQQMLDLFESANGHKPAC
jgi:glycosyltransferase involved in cell wall biosynthesis